MAIWKELATYYGDEGTTSTISNPAGGTYSNWAGTELSVNNGTLIEGDATGTCDSVPLNIEQGMIKWSSRLHLSDEDSDNQYGFGDDAKWYYDGVQYSLNNLGDYTLEPANSAGTGGSIFPIPLLVDDGASTIAMADIYTGASNPPSSKETFFDNVTIKSPEEAAGNYIHTIPDGLMLEMEGGHTKLAWNSIWHRFNGGEANLDLNMGSLPDHNHNSYKYISGTGDNAIFGDALLRPDNGHSTVTSVTVDHDQFALAFVDDASDKWHVYNLNQQGTGNTGTHLVPYSGSPCDEVKTETDEWASLNDVTSAGKGNITHDLIRQYFTPIIWDTKGAQDIGWIDGSGLGNTSWQIGGVSGAGDSAFAGLDAKYQVGSGDTTYAGTVICHGSFVLVNYTKLLAGSVLAAEGGGVTQATHQTHNKFMLLNAGIMDSKVIIGDLEADSMSMTANMQAPISGDISDVANITNLVTIDANTINESTEHLMIPVNGRMKLQGGSASWYEGDNSTELVFGTKDADDDIDTIEDFAFMWKHGAGESDSGASGYSAKNYTAITHKTFASDVDWALGELNPFKVAMDLCTETANRTNDELKSDWSYDSVSGLCDTATLNVSAIDYMDGMTDAAIIALPGSMFNAPGTSISDGIAGVDGTNDKIFIKIPDNADGEYEATTSL